MSFKSFAKNNKLVLGATGAAVLVAVVAGVGVSGANFSASQAGHVSISTGTLTVGLTDDKGTSNSFDLAFTNLKPGEVQEKNFYVTNTGSIPAVAKVGQPITAASIQSAGKAAIDPSKLSVGISGITGLTPVTQLSTFGLGTIQPGETKKFTLDVSLDSSAGNEWQGATVSANATVTLDQQ